MKELVAEKNELSNKLNKLEVFFEIIIIENNILEEN